MSRGFFDWVSDAPRDVALQVLVVGWMDYRKTKGSCNSIHCGRVNLALAGKLINGARDCQLAVVRWSHLDQ